MKDSLRNQFFFGLVTVCAVFIIWHLFIISYVRHSSYVQASQIQTQQISNVLVRGDIYVQDPQSTATGGKYLVATNKKFPDLYITPSQVSDSGAVINNLHNILSIDTSAIQTILDTNSTSPKILSRKISDSQAAQITALSLKGLSIQNEMDRYYPSDSLLSNVLGFLGFNTEGSRAGQYGVESELESQLSGEAATASPAPLSFKPSNIIASAIQYFKSGSVSSSDTPAPDDVVLTIDKNVQSFVENELDSTLKKWSATGGTVIVQDPQTGKIIAMASRPTFDPNNYNASPTANFANRNFQEYFEPGSSFKPITMAAGLDLGKVTPTTTYTDTGELDIAGFKIHDFDNLAHGTVDMTTVLEKSLNLGAAFVESQIGQDSFSNYVVNFGFGQKTGIDLPGEVSGDIANLYSGRQVNFVTASFGQGIAVTPLQLINAYSAIANGGKLMRPYVVDQIIHSDGTVQTTQPEVVSIPIKKQTSDTLKTMLVNVVDNGFDKARIKGYSIAGKTGTAQIPSPNGGYEPAGNFIHDFLGFAPASNPKFVVLVKMDRPKGITFAADSLSPTFRDIAAFLLNYYNIPPDR